MPFEGSLVRLNSRQCSELEEIARSQSLPAGFVLRAKIVLLLAQGLSYQAVVAKLDTSAPTVGKWKKRFLEHGLDGLETHRPGQPPRKLTASTPAKQRYFLNLEGVRGADPSGAVEVYLVVPDDGGGAAQLLDQLIALGIRLSLDDFGTGYSSLGYLRKTQFSTIKVDRSFVQGAAKGTPESIAIIRAVVALADSLGMATTAEGAETELEVETIRTLGCSNIQGYYYGRPMPSSDVLVLFRAPESSSSAAA